MQHPVWVGGRSTAGCPSTGVTGGGGSARSTVTGQARGLRRCWLRARLHSYQKALLAPEGPSGISSVHRIRQSCFQSRGLHVFMVGLQARTGARTRGGTQRPQDGGPQGRAAGEVGGGVLGRLCRCTRSSWKGLTVTHFYLVEVFKTCCCQTWCFPEAPHQGGMVLWASWTPGTQEAKTRASARAGTHPRVPAQAEGPESL